jgi:hypothetical protein
VATQAAQFEAQARQQIQAEKKEERKGLKRNALQALSKSGGADETRTRDLRRDRPAF